jgi:hypothetical protein
MIKSDFKDQILKVVLDQLPEHIKINLDDASKHWFVDFRKEGGLRLSDAGDLAFRTADLEFFDFPFTVKDLPDGLSKGLVRLSKRMKCPYYLGTKKVDGKVTGFVRIYDSRIAMMINLYGNFASYIESLREI